MPRPSYYQSPGNPVQVQLLPDEPLQIQFAHRTAESDRDASRTLLRNLYLLSTASAVVNWVGWDLSDWMPLGLLLIGMVIYRTPGFWKDQQSYRPHRMLLAVPCLMHLFAIPFVFRIAIVMVTAAYVGREFARHYVYVNTTLPCTREAAERIRDHWEFGTLFSSLLVLPLGLMVCVPLAWFQCCVMLAIGLVTSVVLTNGNPAMAFANLRAAWRSWCSYNRHDLPAAGVLHSPAGPTTVRIGLLVLLVMQVSLLFTRITFMPGFVIGQTIITSGPKMQESLLGFGMTALVWTVGVLAWIGMPVGISLLFIGLVTFPAAMAITARKESPNRTDEWKHITDSVRNSTNAIERNSLFMGRLEFDGSPLLVPRAVFQEHAHILGDSGSGKTARGLIPLAEQLVADGESSLMVIDLKGDSQEMLASLQIAAQRTDGPPIPIRYFSIREDQATFAFNIFQLPCWTQLNLFQRTDVLCGALGLVYGTDYGQGYFSSANAAVLYTTLRHFPDIGSFAELAERLTYVMQHPKSHGLDDVSSQAGNHVWMTAERLASFKPLNVTPHATPNADVHRQAIDPASLFARQEICYFHLSSTLGPGSSPEIARLAMFMLLTSATLMKRPRPVYLLIDEFQRVAAHNVDAILQIARSMNVGVILANQSMTDLKRSHLDSVLESNCRYRQWYAVSCPEEQQRLSKASGETVDVMYSTTTTRGTELLQPKTTISESLHQFVAPRLTLNDVKLASDDPGKSIVLVNRGSGYSQFGAMPVVVESEFHISESEFLKRKHSDWPAGESGTFVPTEWKPQQSPKSSLRKHRGPGPQVTEETIGDAKTSGKPNMFDTFLAAHQRHERN